MHIFNLITSSCLTKIHSQVLLLQYFLTKIWASIDESLPPSNIQSTAYKCYALGVTKLKHLHVYNTIIVGVDIKIITVIDGTFRKLSDG
jgi:hypothetical protein